MKIEEIYAIPTNGDRWRLLPNGNNLLIGANVSAPYGFDIASIGEWARIGEGARIGDKVQWLKSPLAVQGTRHLVTNCAPGQINIGCHIFTFEKFQQATPAERAEFQIANGYTPEECAEYIKIVEFVIANGVPAESEAAK